jgi:hypothetical protein
VHSFESGSRFLFLKVGVFLRLLLLHLAWSGGVLGADGVVTYLK